MLLVSVALLFSWGCRVIHAEEDAPFFLPPGFKAEPFAGDELAHDIYSLTINGEGNVVVSGPGYIKVLHDDDGDHRAERSTLFSDRPLSGAHGLLCVDQWLFATGDEVLLRFEDANRDGVADGKPEVMAQLSSSEHGASGLALGPDGWIYMTCGNEAKVNSGWKVSPSSPLRSAEAGAIVRMTPDGQVKEILAEGFRNPYDLAFAEQGELLTVDSDGERDHHLPWYEPTRVFQVQLGGHHGWLLQGWQQSWSRPAHCTDSVPRLAELGRGSPTGVCVYRHTQFPAKYQGSLFSACWTMGRVYHVPLQRTSEGLVSSSPPEIFLQTNGDVGFAPVDMAVGPKGDLFVAIGGRRTRGGVFRISYQEENGVAKGSDAAAPEEWQDMEFLAAKEPLSAWSRAEWLPRLQKVSRSRLMEAAQASSLSVAQRLRAIELLTEFHGGLLDEECAPLIASTESAVVARALWSRSRTHHRAEDVVRFQAATQSADAIVQQQGWEGLLTNQPVVFDPHGWMNAWDRTNSRTFAMAQKANASSQPTDDIEARPKMFAKGDAMSNPLGQMQLLVTMLEALEGNAPLIQTQRLRLIRQMQIVLGDIYTAGDDAKRVVGYSSGGSALQLERLQQGVNYASLVSAMENATPECRQEIARVLAMLQEKGVLAQTAFLKEITEASPVPHDLHYLFCLAQLADPIAPENLEPLAAAIAQLHPKMQNQSRQVSRNWPRQVQALVHRLFAKHPLLASRVIAHESMQWPQQALLFQEEGLAVQKEAAQKLLEACKKRTDFWQEEVTPELAELLLSLPVEEALPSVRQLWDNVTLRDRLAPFLSEHATQEDRPRLLAGLSSFAPATVEKCAEALNQLEKPTERLESDFAPVLLALRQACTAPDQRSVRQSLDRLLQDWTGESHAQTPKGKKESPQDYQGWFVWEKKQFPSLAIKDAQSGESSWGDWQKRIAGTRTLEGDRQQGEILFRRLSCIKCHAGSGPLGPSLIGVHKRFSTEDLVRAIVEPSRDVAPTYQTWQVVTRDGKTFSGILVYESPEATLLQTSAEETVRIAGDNLELLRRSSRSLMPEGLLRNVSDQELTDLLAYLQEISAK